jgi:hypothetical protein
VSSVSQGSPALTTFNMRMTSGVIIRSSELMLRFRLKELLTDREFREGRVIAGRGRRGGGCSPHDTIRRSPIVVATTRLRISSTSYATTSTVALSSSWNTFPIAQIFCDNSQEESREPTVKIMDCANHEWPMTGTEHVTVTVIYAHCSCPVADVN